VNQVMRETADELAAAGYLAICPDLFWRIEPGVDITDKTEAEWKKAFALMNAFDADAGVEDIDATIDAARADAGCTGKVGAVGFCLGGQLAFLTAARTDVDASVAYYGVGIEKLVGEADKIAQPLMMHIAEEDQFVPKEAQAVILQALKNHPQITIHTYAGRDHAFARHGGEHYDEADAKLAAGRTLAFFQQHLGE
jgi:carboxymethylenebutenolidase